MGQVNYLKLEARRPNAEPVTYEAFPLSRLCNLCIGKHRTHVLPVLAAVRASSSLRPSQSSLPSLRLPEHNISLNRLLAQYYFLFLSQVLLILNLTKCLRSLLRNRYQMIETIYKNVSQMFFYVFLPFDIQLYLVFFKIS